MIFFLKSLAFFLLLNRTFYYAFFEDRQRQAERKQQEIEREAERKRKYTGASVVK